MALTKVSRGLLSTSIVDNGNATAITIDSSENVGIGTSSPSTKLTVSGSVRALRSDDATQYGDFAQDSSGGYVSTHRPHASLYENFRFLASNNSGSVERMRIDSSGNVQVKGGNELRVYRGDNATYGSMKYLTGSGGLQLNDTNGDGISFVQANGATEYARIDSSGNLLVGTTSTDPAASSTETGVALKGGGFVSISRNDSAASVNINKIGYDGSLVDFRKNGSTVGSIGVKDSDIYIGKDAVGLSFDSTGADGIRPFNISGQAYRDNAIDLGGASARFDDIYATNGTIQTSDRNEKQDIAELSEAEQRVAVAAKGLLRKFRWKDSVAEKGDDARIHFGIIAQDLQAAFEAEGLDAGDYAMFISTTWTDEETNEEKTRMGVRYSELLAFIISAI